MNHQDRTRPRGRDPRPLSMAQDVDYTEHERLREKIDRQDAVRSYLEPLVIFLVWSTIAAIGALVLALIVVATVKVWGLR